MARLKFIKMHGAGNDYIYMSGADVAAADRAALARRLADRHRGIGGDGLILVCPSRVANCRMEMYNADGSRAEMCGNGIRCVAKYAYETGMARVSPMSIETDAGTKHLDLEIDGDRVTAATVDMGEPILDGERIPVAAEGRVIDRGIDIDGEERSVTCVSMGNPHCVVFESAVDDLPLDRIGPRFEGHPMFPQRINTEFVQVIRRDHVRMRVWERGTGETLACGTGACAAVVAGVLTGRTERAATVELRGGSLQITWATDGRVRLRGDAVRTFEGTVEV